MKPKRKKVQRDWLENQLAKYERRIQKLAESAYDIRRAIEVLDNQEAARNKEKEELTNAVYNSGIEAATSGEQANSDTRQPELSNNLAVEAVLGEQPTELPVDK